MPRPHSAIHSLIYTVCCTCLGVCRGEAPLMSRLMGVHVCLMAQIRKTQRAKGRPTRVYTHTRAHHNLACEIQTALQIRHYCMIQSIHTPACKVLGHTLLYIAVCGNDFTSSPLAEAINLSLSSLYHSHTPPIDCHYRGVRIDIGRNNA